MNYPIQNPNETLQFRQLPTTTRETCCIQLDLEQNSIHEAKSNQSSIPACPEFPDSTKTWVELFQEREPNEVFICPHEKLILCKCCANFCKNKDSETQANRLDGSVLTAPKKANSLERLLQGLKEQREMLKNEILGVTEKMRNEIDEWYHENVLRLCSIKAIFFNDLQVMEAKIIENTALEADVKGFEESIKKLKNEARMKGLENVIDFCDTFLDNTLEMKIRKKTQTLRKIQKFIVKPNREEMRKTLDKLVTISDKNTVSKVKFPILVNVDLYTAANFVRWLNP